MAYGTRPSTWFALVGLSAAATSRREFRPSETEPSLREPAYANTPHIALAPPGGGASSLFVFLSGILQGCPLSCFLFTLG